MDNCVNETVISPKDEESEEGEEDEGDVEEEDNEDIDEDAKISNEHFTFKYWI